jgi:hypothetical protein
MWPGGFDPNGTYIAEGETDGAVAICSAEGAISFNATIYAPGSVMWDGKYFALTDREAGGAFQTAIYQARLSGTALTSQGETILSDTCYADYTDVSAPFVVGTKNTPKNKEQGMVVVGSNALCPGTFDYWAYPAGGAPTMSLPSAPEEPSGESVSIKE